MNSFVTNPSVPKQFGQFIRMNCLIRFSTNYDKYEALTLWGISKPPFLVEKFLVAKKIN